MMKLAKKEIRKAIEEELLRLRIQVESAVWIVDFIDVIGMRLILDRLDLAHKGAFNPELASVYGHINQVKASAKAWVKQSKRLYERELELSKMDDDSIVAMIRKQAGR